MKLALAETPKTGFLVTRLIYSRSASEHIQMFLMQPADQDLHCFSSIGHITYEIALLDLVEFSSFSVTKYNVPRVHLYE